MHCTHVFTTFVKLVEQAHGSVGAHVVWRTNVLIGLVNSAAELEPVAHVLCFDETCIKGLDINLYVSFFR